MRRRGFTLVELLIVVAILGVLAAIMTVSSGSSVSKARATTIANNLKICTTAAQIYYLESGDNDDTTTGISTIKIKDVLEALVTNWDDFNSNSTIKYEVSGDETGPENWGIKVTLTGTDKDDVLAALKNIKGFSKATASPVYYKVFEGNVERAGDSSNG